VTTAELLGGAASKPRPESSSPGAGAGTPPVALTIAGSDSGGGAGIAADLRTFAAHRVHGTLAVTVVTAQNTLGVSAIRVMDEAMVASQIDAVMSDLHPRAAKTGLLATPEIVKVVTSKLHEGLLPPLVVDPVLVGSAGDPLYEGTTVKDSYRELIAGAAVVTPNLPEAALLVGWPIDDVAAMEQAARELHALGAGLVVVKGGRRLGEEAIDVAYDGRTVTHLAAAFVMTRNVHGTGCSFAAATAANIALGHDLLTAAIRAKDYVHQAIELAASWDLGGGHGPIDQVGAASASRAGGLAPAGQEPGAS
jgi:hydroxymethylpyrimidine/phosphomethylpyrimidine kinase